MKAILIKRLMQSMVALLLLVLFSFLVSRVLPGDPAKYILSFNNSQVVSTPEGRARSYERQYRKMGLHQPYFYVSMESRLLPDSFIHLPDNDFKFLLCSLSYYSGNPRLSLHVTKSLFTIKDKTVLYSKFQSSEVSNAIDEFLLNDQLRDHTKTLASDLTLLKLNHNKNYWKRWIPQFHWNPTNQFHFWFFGESNNSSGLAGKGIVNGDFGISWIRGDHVLTMLKYPFLLTLLLSAFILLVTFPVALLLGGWLSLNHGRWYARFQKPLQIFIYSIPTFWMGTALLWIFANPRMLDWLPTAAPVLKTSAGGLNWMYSLISQGEYLIIPLVALGYSTVIYLSQLVLELLREELQKPYVMTLRAIGCSERRIIFYHAMKSILAPVIVSGMSVFPLLLGGSVIIDFLFSMPGLGTLLLQACDQKDFPVVSGVLFFSGLVTILSFALTDFLTAYVNPLIRYSNKNKYG
ncbi:MAG: ABC transporter permease [Bacteroidetes bacterium]|nr:ABC transporter permease [Bacteroidota bacterium]